MRKSPEAGNLYNRQRTSEVKTDEIARRTAGLPEREPLGIVPSNQRLVRIENSSYPHTPAHNVMGFSFVDATFTATAGAQTLTPTDRGTDGVVLNLAGVEIPDQTIVMAYSYENDPRWYTSWGVPNTQPILYWQGYNSGDQEISSTNDISSPMDLEFDEEEFTAGAAYFDFDDATGELLVKVARKFRVSYDVLGIPPSGTQTYDAAARIWMQKKPSGGAYANYAGSADDIWIPLESTPVSGDSFARNTAHKTFYVQTSVNDTYKMVGGNISSDPLASNVRINGRGMPDDIGGGLWVWTELR
jgi:hypothetical protein